MANEPIDMILEAAHLLRQRDDGEGSSSQNQAENSSESDADSESDDMEETESNTPGGGNSSSRERVGQKGKVSLGQASSRGRKGSEGRCREERPKQDACEKHNLKERERRKGLKQAVLKLRNQLRRPTKKPSTITVLTAAQQEIRVLKSMEKEEEQELDALKRRFTFNTWRLEKALTDYKESAHSGLRPHPSPASAPISPFFLPPPHPGHSNPLIAVQIASSTPSHIASFEGSPAMHPAVGFHMIPSPFSPTSLPGYRSPPHHFTMPPPRSPFMIPHMSTMHRYMPPTALYSLPHAPNYPIPVWNPAVVGPMLPYPQQEAPTYNNLPGEGETRERDKSRTENSLEPNNSNSHNGLHYHSVIRRTMPQASLYCPITHTVPASTSEEDIVVDVVRSPDEEEHQTQLIEQTNNYDHKDQNSIKTEEIYSSERNQYHGHKHPKNFPEPPALRRAGVDTDAAVVSKIIEQVRPQRELLSQRAIDRALEKHAPFSTIDSGNMHWYSEEKNFNSTLKQRRGKRNGLKHRVRTVPVLS